MKAEEMKFLDHIPTDEIIKDIKDTEKEVTDYEDELEVLMRNPRENKLRIYMIEGNLLKHREFIIKLNEIKKYRHDKLK